MHDLSLAKKASELLASRLREKNLLKEGIRFSHYLQREQEFLQFFSAGKRDRTNHWLKNWPVPESLSPCNSNIENQPLLFRDKIILPPLHLKFEIMKQFIKPPDESSARVSYIREEFLAASYEKIKTGAFDRLQI